MSDAVDRSVASIDFRPLSGRHVFLDTTYVKNIKSEDFVNADYIISSVRQQMVGAGCLLEETQEAAEYVAEMRIGTLGTDSHDVVYGIPANNALSSAASLVPSAPAFRSFPRYRWPARTTRRRRPRSPCLPIIGRHGARCGNRAWPRRTARPRTRGSSGPGRLRAAPSTTERSSSAASCRFRC